MAKIHSILQGFVDLNMETDENNATRIVPEGTIRQESAPFNNDSSSLNSPTLTLPVSIDELVQKIGIEPSAVKLAHIQGSRLYGVDSPISDWDLAVVASGVNGYQFKEINIDGVEYDIHTYSQDRFQTFLDNHNMKELESLYHPSGVRLVDKVEFSVDIDPERLVEKVREESDSLWNRAESDLDAGNDPYTAHKKIWHSFRFILFAVQILEQGEITNFSEANGFYDIIVKSGRDDFKYFEDTFGATREELKNSLDQYLPGDITLDDTRI